MYNNYKYKKGTSKKTTVYSENQNIWSISEFKAEELCSYKKGSIEQKCAKYTEEYAVWNMKNEWL